MFDFLTILDNLKEKEGERKSVPQWILDSLRGRRNRKAKAREARKRLKKAKGRTRKKGRGRKRVSNLTKRSKFWRRR